MSAARGGEARRTARGVGMGTGTGTGRAGIRSWLSFGAMMGHFLVVVAAMGFALWAGGVVVVMRSNLDRQKIDSTI